ncbi:TAXI family TRAP transporter solute-binding subunit [Rickettsiales bacterium]|nr:TAXI family TRAP transporter solute-binding subunit [Rickettsiales bacterium]
MRKITKITIFTIIGQLLLSFNASASTKYISIATGAITGVYYPTGGAICRLVNRGRKDHGIRCSVESTGGSVANLNALRNRVIDFGIVQSDWQYHAFKGTGFFGDQPPYKDLRSIASFYTETFAIAVKHSSGISKIDDLIGKNVNFGPVGSGMYATMEVLSSVKGWSKSDFKSIAQLNPSEQPEALCNNRIDAMIYVSGNPNGVLQEATQYQDPNCKVKILNIDRPTIKKLVKINPFYVKAIIPGGMYNDNPKNIETFGIKATLVTSKSIKSDIVYNVTKALFNNFDNFKTLHPVFTALNIKNSVTEGNSAPLHPGAIRYYKEVGLLK